MTEIIFWKDVEKQKVDPTLFSAKAQDLALKLAEDNSKIRKVNKRTQIRKFYDEVVKLDTEAKSRSIEEWDYILPLVHMLTAKAAYAKGRELVSDAFVNFIKSSVDQIKKREDLAVFAGFFEALMGFYTLHGPSN